jgi:ABC-type cobalamin/Fe3+-siderophores transport system ATPase subunit
MPVKISGIAKPIDGNSPIVVIGPNGVGKTRLGVLIARENDAERVAALRNVEIGGIPMQTLEQASAEVKRSLNEVMASHWRQSFELQQLLSEIIAEDRDGAVKYRADRERNPADPVDPALTNTRLSRVVQIWNRHFPGRRINIGYQPMVERTTPTGVSSYSIAQMSEGERTALYLAARAVSCSKGLLIVDEPESFFHPLLARRLWDDLEREVPNVRFLYITHDIPFALSRKSATFAIARSEISAELLPSTTRIPSEIITEVLGAASFSISASRLIFCEGTQQRSLDAPILQAWHDCPKTTVVPVGGCNSVRECVSVFRAGQVTGGLEAFGYIDRDSWPQSHLESTSFVKPHPVSEIEGIFCIEPIFLAMAKYNGASSEQASAQFAAFLSEARVHFQGPDLNKEILNRSKARVEIEQKALFNPIRPNADLNIVRGAFVAAEPTGGWSAYLSTIFSDEEARLNRSLSSSPADFVMDFPAKAYFSIAARHAKFVPEKMIEALCSALKLKDIDATKEQKLRELRDAIVPVLEPLLWPRYA